MLLLNLSKPGHCSKETILERQVLVRKESVLQSGNQKLGE